MKESFHVANILLKPIYSFNYLLKYSVFSTTKVITVKSKPKCWRFGIQGGYGYTPKGFQPYLGIGGSYNF